MQREVLAVPLWRAEVTRLGTAYFSSAVDTGNDATAILELLLELNHNLSYSGIVFRVRCARHGQDQPRRLYVALEQRGC